MADSGTIVKAYEEGQKKMAESGAGGPFMEGAYDTPLSKGSPVQTIDEYDPTTSPYFISSASSATVNRFGLKPGQTLGHHGTTIFNPMRSSKEVEAVLGEKRYNPKVEAKSPEQMLVRQAELENQVNSLQKQMSVLITALQMQAQTSVSEDNPITPIIIPIEKTFEERTVHDLREEAKNKSLPYVGKNKAQLIEILRNVPTGT